MGINASRCTDLNLHEADDRFRPCDPKIAASRELRATTDGRAINHSHADDGEPAFGVHRVRRSHVENVRPTRSKNADAKTAGVTTETYLMAGLKLRKFS